MKPLIAVELERFEELDDAVLRKLIVAGTVVFWRRNMLGITDD